MPKTEAGETSSKAEGLSLATVLRDCLRCGVLMLDGEDRIAMFTAQARTILGLVKTNHTSRLQDLPSAVQELVGEIRTTGKPFTDHLLEVAEDGFPSRAVLVNAFQSGENGSAGSLTVILNDIAGPARISARLQRLDRLASLGTLSSTLAHEMKNAMVAGKTFVDALLEKHPEAELAEVVRREFRRLDTLLSQMLKWAGTEQPAFARVQVHAAIDHALRLIEHPARMKSVSIERAYGQTAVVVGNQAQLEQVFLNLFLNALEAMNQPGTLRVAAELTSPPAAQSRLSITVSDTGYGFAPDVLPRLFEAFFTTKDGGTGLGLSISRQILANHNGAISAANRPGGGAEFTILLPVA